MEVNMAEGKTKNVSKWLKQKFFIKQNWKTYLKIKFKRLV